ncbi:uncharacterized protein LOC123560918 [Mercenaria mercenaria]|uniref:uncharacterized protein LOC123560918 n=1 Tax=Mercenaria mercenaria TaxID=6596 RepID=UPI00234F3EF8|nr:uncharacterized protein LOC123560918 [Mercenaria mercenaria]
MFTFTEAEPAALQNLREKITRKRRSSEFQPEAKRIRVKSCCLCTSTFENDHRHTRERHLLIPFNVDSFRDRSPDKGRFEVLKSLNERLIGEDSSFTDWMGWVNNQRGKPASVRASISTFLGNMPGTCIPHVSDCRDKSSNCEKGYKDLCKHFKEFALISCRKSCNFCKVCEFPPPVPANGSVTITADVFAVTYECDLGFYRSTGDSQRTCKERYSPGKWSGKLPTCSPVIGQNCTNGHVKAACTKIAHADCVGPVCKCDESYRNLAGISCEEVHLSSCSQDKDCISLTHSKCIGKNESRDANSRCMCENGYYYKETSHSCYKDCGGLSNPSNGKVDLTNGTTYQSVAKYECNTGYTLHGASDTTCTAKGNWTEHFVNCTINVCQLPDLPVHVEFVSDVKNGTDLVYNTTLLYRCVAGYGFQSNATTHENKTIRCQANSSFSHFETCKLKVCQLPDTLHEKHIVIVTDVKNKTELSYNTTLQYTCEGGYGFERNATTHEHKSITCQENASFSDFKECKRKDCGQLPKKDQNNRWQNVSLTNSSSDTYYLSAATAYCLEGYRIQGERNDIVSLTFMCQSNMTWGPIPQCEKKDCSEPGSTTHGSYSPVHGQTFFNDNVTYECDPGFETTEKTFITCNSSGSWSSPPPKCRDINECDLYTANCHRRADCTNTIGSYTCKCQEGFRDISVGGIGLNCEDKNECTNASANTCNKNGSQCINYPGGFLCLCDEGWTGNTCDTDINECNTTGCGEKAYCTNYAGGYNCTCNDGFPKGDPKIHCYVKVILDLETVVKPFRGDNQLIDAQPIKYRFPYFGDEYNSYRPNMNGFLTLGYQPVYEDYGPETPDDWKKYSRGNTVIAPFWTDIDSTNLTGGLYVHLFEYYTNYRQNNSQQRDLSYLGSKFTDYLNLTDFIPRVALVASWINVTQSSYIEPSRLIKTHNATMQAILISDGIYSYLMFNYDHEQWSFKIDNNIPSSAGFTRKDKTGYIIATSQNFSQLNTGTNLHPGLNGRWIYNVSSNNTHTNNVLRNESECLAFRHNETIKNWITAKRDLSYPCPCSEQQMQLDYSYREVDPMYKHSHTPPVCYEAWFFNNDGVKQTCCYSYGALKKEATGGGFATFETDLYNTTEYFYKCCDENTDRHLCHLFYEMNPSDDCSRFNPADEPFDRYRRSLFGNMRSGSDVNIYRHENKARKWSKQMEKKKNI